MRWASHVPRADVLSALCRPGRIFSPGLIRGLLGAVASLAR